MAPDPFSFHSSLSFNWIFVMQSLNTGELQTGKRLVEDRFQEIKMGNKIDFCHTYLELPDRGAFFSAVNNIANMCKSGIKPILHFDLHGLRNKSGIALLPSKESLSWQEFASVCRTLNALCSNNLMIVMASCYGLHAITEVSIKEISPYCYLIGSQEQVSAGAIDTGFKEFYSVLLKTCDVDSAMKTLDSRFRLYIAEKLFMVSFSSYLREGCLGKGRRQRIERLLTEYVELMKREGRSVRLKVARNSIKLNTKPNKEAFARFANRFLMADYPANSGRFNCVFEDAVYVATNMKYQ